MMPTLEDVAKRAGVSTATVSKVLSNTPYFTEATRQKVMQAVEEIGYVPNLAARALSTGKTHIIAVVFPYVYDAIFKDPLVMSILEGIETEATAQGYNLLLSTPRLTAKGADKHYKQLLQSGYIDGIIAIDNVPIASAAAPAHKRNIPTIVIGYHEADYFVRGDDHAGGTLLMNHVLELGHRDMGIVTVPEKMNLAVNERLRGLQSAAASAGLDYHTFPISYGDYSIESGAHATQSLLDSHPEITAIICLNDRMAMGAVQQAQVMGRDVPGHLTIVGYDNIPSAEIFTPALTTIDQHAPALGRTAAQMMFAALNGQTPESAVLPVELKIRRSSAAPG